MSVEVQWTDTDPDTGERRFVAAEKFARKWSFKVRYKRRQDWSRRIRLTREVWETLLEALERRYRRSEGVKEDDLADVRKILAEWTDAPTVEDL
jgi:hypothetical protein